MHEIPLREALEERYLAYALSTIMHRALPDARDGLKPVHRRILYGMRLLRLDPGTAPKKSAKIVGDVMGTFHPHGDQSIYDALVRLAQDFSSRYPLVDGQGNFGNIDGDNAGRLSLHRSAPDRSRAAAARRHRRGRGRLPPELRRRRPQEPVVLPAAFPNLLANGAQGIAVGMATSIPPHNAAELCDAALHLIDKPATKSRGLLKYVKGPDFPTGGIVVDPHESIAEAYATGRGSFRVRAQWKQEEGARGTWVVVVTEIPWLVQKSRLIERIAELLNEKKLPLLADIRDESAEDVRIVIEPKSRNVDPDAADGVAVQADRARKPHPAQPERAGEGPRPAGHRPREVPARMARPSPRRADPALEATAWARSSTGSKCSAATSIAYLNLDKVIKIIRTEDEPKPVLMKTFKLTDVQADAILNMRLRTLRKLEEMEIRTEDKELRAELKGIKSLLGSEDEQWKKRRRARSRRCATRSARRRRSASAARSSPTRRSTTCRRSRRRWSSASRSPSSCSEKGWIRTHEGPDVEDLSSLAFKTDDKLGFAFFAETTVQAAAALDQRPVLHARCLEAAGRARPRRADPPVHRHGAGGRHRHDVRQQAAAASSWSRAATAAASSSTRTTASATPARASRC